jgi:ABC-type Zn uptake system ZnuABC Zn-binding protein ZnuA
MEGLYGKLCKKYPDMAKKSEKKLEEVQENWNRLEDLANARFVLNEMSFLFTMSVAVFVTGFLA